MIETKNASRPTASRHTILMGTIGIAAAAALGLPVVLVASHELAVQSSSIGSQQGQTMSAVTPKDGQDRHCQGRRSS